MLGVRLWSDRVQGLSLALTSFCLRLGFLLCPMIGFPVKKSGVDAIKVWLGTVIHTPVFFRQVVRLLSMQCLTC